MAIQTVTDAIRYVGVDDNTLALFENQYSVQPMGVSYNSYVILDEKIAVMDSVDARAAEEWLSNVARVLEGRSPDYLVITHMEPDHSGSLMRLAQKYPEMKIVGNAKTFTLIKQFFGTGALSEDRMLEVGERDTLSLGLHRLRFLLAPMVHWPEVIGPGTNIRMTRALPASSAGEPHTATPASEARLTAGGYGSYPATGTPLSINFFAQLLPITPSPTMPTVSISNPCLSPKKGMTSAPLAERAGKR